jgi:hypothetical protein
MPPAEPEDERLRELRERLSSTEAAARRLADQAAASARAVPPGGWQAPAPETGDDPGSAELSALLRAFEGLRGVIPPELQEQLVAVVRELLLALRALVDYVISRLEQRREAESTVEDIPIA